jgi:hypothetical protein
MTTSTFAFKDVAHVSKFNGGNFPFWKFQIVMLLEQHKLTGITLGTEKKPDESDANKKKIEEWLHKDNTARCFIVSTIEERWQKTLITCKTASEMWKRLAAQHEKSSQENKHILQQKFYEYQYQPHHSVLEHISEVEYIASQLEDLGETLSPLQIIAKITSTLPPSYRSIVSMWNIIPDSTKTVSMPTSHLLAEETLVNMHGGDKPADAPFFLQEGGSRPHHNSRQALSDRERRKTSRASVGTASKKISVQPIEKTSAGGKKPT